MDIAKRKSLLALLALPAGCSLTHLPAFDMQAVRPGWQPPPIRPPQIGQSWVYNKFNFYNSQLIDQVKERVSSLDNSIRLERQSSLTGDLPAEIHSTWGWVTQDPSWDVPQIFETPLPLWLPELAVGTQRSNHTHYQSPDSSFKYWLNTTSTVVGWGQVQLPIGTFDTVRIDKLIRLAHPNITKLDLLRRDTLWFAPEIGRWVAREMQGDYRISGKNYDRGLEDRARWELAQLDA